ncbi:MAG: hypothetical protein ABSH20_14870, partial [Tepidisphaeraceae bacterium]
ENALIVSDFHGFWSHAEPVKGSRYLVMAAGGSNDVAVLMQESAITGLVDAAVAVDVKAAVAAEKQFAGALRPQVDPAARRDAALGLLKLTYEKRSGYGGCYGRYLWARVAPVYAVDEAALLPAVLETVQARDANRDLREALIYGVYDEIVSLGPTPQRSLGLIRPLLGLAPQPEAAPMMDRLLQVPIWNLLYRPGVAPPSPATVIPDAAARAEIAAVVSRYKSERARRIARWLTPEEPPQ